jgi:hypothetical protein
MNNLEPKIASLMFSMPFDVLLQVITQVPSLLNGLHIHFGKFLKCARLPTSTKQIRTKVMVPIQPVEHQVALTDYPWDIANNSMDKLGYAAIGTLTDEYNDAGASNNRAGTYSKSVNERFGIHVLLPNSITKL